MNKRIPKLFIIGFWISSLALAHNLEASQSAPPIKKTWTIGYFNAPPLGYQNKSGLPEGMVIDLLNKVANDNQLNITWQYGEFPALMTAIQAGEIDILPGLGYSIERDKFLDFSSQHFANAWGQVFLPTYSKIETIFELDGKTIALLTNGINGENFKQQCQLFEVNCHTVYANTYEEIFELLNQKKVDAVVSNNLVGSSLSYKYKFFDSNILFSPFKIYITQNPNLSKDFMNAFDNSIAEWKKTPNSFYYQTRQKWLGFSGHHPMPQWLFYSLISVLLLTVGALITAFFYRRLSQKTLNAIMIQKKQLNQILNHMPHLIFVNDYRGNLILINHATTDFLGIPLDYTQPHNLYRLVHDYPTLKPLIEHTSAVDSIHHEVIIKNHKNEERTLMVSKTPMLSNHKNSLLLTVAVDITDSKEFENKIKHMAQHDHLTGLSNINLMREHLQAELKICRHKKCSGALMFIDIDQFKMVNDAQGHRLGDVILKAVATRLADHLRINDMVARLSSDVFILHVTNLNESINIAEQQATEIADLLCERINDPIVYNNKSYYVSAGIGIALYPRDGVRNTLLFQRADTALYEAKCRGRGRVRVFTSDMETAVKERHALENDFQKGLKNNEFQMVYQPIINAADEQICGWEALARWHHPQRGLIMPDVFIPVAEQSALLRTFGYWVIEQVCQKISKQALHAPNTRFFISANLSINQLKDRHFLSKVNDLINTYHVKPGTLEFEITESILMYESKQAADILNQLKLMGIKIAIDDFGTGYSSFSHLRQLPFDKIKIDRSFIEQIPKNTNHVAMVKSIIAMTREMNLEIVAEGIETEAQYKLLKMLKCDYYQGFYFAKPAPQLTMHTLPR